MMADALIFCSLYAAFIRIHAAALLILILAFAFSLIAMLFAAFRC